MRTSLWPFGLYERLSRRERWVVGSGALISALAILVAYVFMPFVRTWNEREASIAAKSAQVARLQALLDGQQSLMEAVRMLEQDSALRARRLFAGSTPALAASSLQTLVRGYARTSRVRLERVDMDRDAEPQEHGLTPVGLQLTVRGDVYGLVDFMFHLQNGDKLLVIDELRVGGVSGGSPIRSATELLGLTIRLHGFHARTEVAA